MALTKPIVCIENVVATGTLNQKLDLDEIKQKFPKISYNPQTFPGASFKIDFPKTTTLIFRTGNLVCTGAKSEKYAIMGINQVVKKLRSQKIKILNEPEISIQNVVTAVNLGGKILIENAARTLPRSMYEPEQFPGLIHRMLDPKTVILLFSSGKLVCTGAKKEPDVYRSVNNLHALLEEKDLILYN